MGGESGGLGNFAAYRSCSERKECTAICVNDSVPLSPRLPRMQSHNASALVEPDWRGARNYVGKKLNS